MAARNISRDLLRRERTRKRYEGEAAMKSDRQILSDTAWDEIEASLNDSLSRLRQADRDIVLKRYFEGLSVRELADEIGTTEDTAAKRLSRAIDRLRRSFKGQEVTATSAMLSALLVEHAVCPVPHSVAAAISLAPQSLSSSSAIHSVKGHSPHSILAKGLFAMSITKIAGGIGLIVLLALLVGFGIYRHSRATQIAANTAVQWSVPSAADPGALAAQQQVRARFEQYMQAWNTYSASAILANLSPDFTEINPGGSKQTYQDFAGFLPTALAVSPKGRSTSVKITSCRIDGNSATLAVQEFHHSSSDDKPFDGDTDSITVTLVNTGSGWLISRIAS